MKRRKRIKFGYFFSIIIFLFLFISVGFASLVTDLNISGILNIRETRFNVHFENVMEKEGSVTPIKKAKIIDDTSISFRVQLVNPGDYYIFNFDIVNSGNLDAMIYNLEKMPELTLEEEKYISYTFKYTNGEDVSVGDLIGQGDRLPVCLSVKFLEGAPDEDLPDEEVILNFRVNISYVQDNGEGRVIESYDDDLVNKVKMMSLDEKIGQMIIINGYEIGTTSTSAKNLVDNIKPGGIILFANNITSASQLNNMISGINEYSSIPLIWGIDQEGGRVQRLNNANSGATTIPYMYDVAAVSDTNLTKEVGRVVGEELKVFGFNMDFAPVADIWSNPENTVIAKRSFGNSVGVVSNHALAFSKGLESTGVTAVYKHFPGHGDTLADSHYALPVITKSKEELMERELKPFKYVIDNGAKAVMVGHLAVPSLTGDNSTPTSLSSNVINGLLREELGFKGLVITDGLSMDALKLDENKNVIRTLEEVYVMAVNAGCDLLLGPNDSLVAFNSIKTAVNNGTIDEGTIDNSVLRILKYKKYDMDTTKLDMSYLANSDHISVINRIPVSE